MKELDDLINFLEANVPANPLAPKNQIIANRLERSLRRYFKQLEAMIPTEQLERIYYTHVKQE